MSSSSHFTKTKPTATHNELQSNYALPLTRPQRRQILSEEDYQETLTQIVRQDYFPDLPELEKQVAVQNKRAQGDLPGAIAVRRAARQLQQQQEVWQEREREEERNALENNRGVRTVPRPLHRESLTGFHARVTSEDNAEFARVQQQELQETRQQRQKWLALTDSRSACQTNKNSNLPLLRDSTTRTPLLLASDQFNPPLEDRQERHAPVQAENSLFFVPNALVQQDEDQPQAQLLMPPPPNVKQSAYLSTNHALVEYIPKERLEKKIVPSATRFPKPQPTILSKLSVSHLEPDTSDEEGATRTDGNNHYYSETDASTDLDAPAPSIQIERLQGARKRRREMETLVQMTPLIVPGQATSNHHRGQDNASPIVTWGSIGGTPLVLAGRGEGVDRSLTEDDSFMDDGESFRMPEESSREKAAARAQAKLEERARKSRAAAKPKSKQLSSAALTLLSKTNMSLSSLTCSHAVHSVLIRPTEQLHLFQYMLKKAIS